MQADTIPCRLRQRNFMQVGNIRIDRVADIEKSAHPAARGFPTLTKEMLQEHAIRLGPDLIDPGSLDLFMSFHTYVVRQGDATMLVDACVGNDKERPARPDWHRRQGDFLERLAAAGVRPQDVDAVLCTHLHADHVGWNTRLVNGQWVPTFPNARYLMAEVELRHFQDKVAREGNAANNHCYPDSVLPVIERGQAELVSTSHRISSGIYTEHAPGHTPGSVLIHIEDGRDDADAPLPARRGSTALACLLAGSGRRASLPRKARPAVHSVCNWWIGRLCRPTRGPEVVGVLGTAGAARESWRRP